MSKCALCKFNEDSKKFQRGDLPPRMHEDTCENFTAIGEPKKVDLTSLKLAAEKAEKLFDSTGGVLTPSKDVLLLLSQLTNVNDRYKKTKDALNQILTGMYPCEQKQCCAYYADIARKTLAEDKE